ncbi:hypothetical protein [Ancylobacter terrae]|uniref:hypothetical protein n=1 Tax=Ancylobacter sp. sgz301288 TaxID=3342077 RepID=UPI003858C86B
MKPFAAIDAIVIGLLAVSTAVVTLCALVLSSGTKVDTGCVMSFLGSNFGSLLGAIATIIAGALALHSTKLSIRNANEEARRHESEAWKETAIRFKHAHDQMKTLRACLAWHRRRNTIRDAESELRIGNHNSALKELREVQPILPLLGARQRLVAMQGLRRIDEFETRCRRELSVASTHGSESNSSGIGYIMEAIDDFDGFFNREIAGGS